MYRNALTVLVNSKGTSDPMAQIFRAAGWILVVAGFVLCLSPYFSFLNSHMPQSFLPGLLAIGYLIAVGWSVLFLLARRKSDQFCGNCGSAFYQEPRCSNSKCRARLVAGQAHCSSCGSAVALSNTRIGKLDERDERQTDTMKAMSQDTPWQS